MKELSIREKAHLYDEAIERANELLYVSDRDSLQRKTVEHIFPELRESEDERIRKQLIVLAKGSLAHTDEEINEMLAWLEKQGEHANFRNKIQIGDKVTRNEEGVLVNLSQLKRVAKKDEKQGENNMGISEATKKKLEDNLNKALEKETPESCNEFLEKQDYQPVNTDYIRGIRVGLLSIEGNAKNINGLTESQWVAIRAANRLLAEYIEKVQQKPAWSEEDEKMFKHIIAKATLHFSSINYLDEEEINFLKSLRPQSTWKPSEEQMDALHYVTNFDYGGHKATLVSLYEQLKKLRKE